MLFWLRLAFAYFCNYLHVLNVFRYFVSCQAALTFCKCSCREATKIHRKSIPKSSKIDENGTQERSESDLGSKLVRGYQNKRYIGLEI